MIEKWTRWEPLPNLASKYDVNAINFGKKGLKITLAEKEQDHKTVIISFKDPIVSYTRTDESFTSGLAYNLSMMYGDVFYAKWTFFKIINSNYTKRSLEKSKKLIYDSSHLIHFSLLTCDDVIDIIADYEPEVTLVTTNICTLMLLDKEYILPIIIRYVPVAKIILYGPRSRGENPTEKYSTLPIQIALDAGYTIDPSVIKQLEESLDDDRGIRVSCEVVDLHAMSDEVRQQILQEGIDWVKAKNI